ncbi:exopolysaccharide biosynthesis protein [Agrobacterium rhizogenes]|nr:exopolysaccharide biosynthesis protein [Rhizobium rhizogenes]NTJ79733.1 exopolysaccharide biosynthesis protein [Rhizobium rhizogenes]
MSVAPPRKKSRAVFWIAAVVIGSIILATALLANDMRNLRALDSRYHLNLFPKPEQQAAAPAAPLQEQQSAHTAAPPAAATSSAPAARNVRVRPASVTAKPSIKKRSHLLDEPVDALLSAFVRSWRISGETLCADLAKFGLPVGEWRQSELGAGTSECSYAIQKGAYGDAKAASFFIIARGKPSGEIETIRIKVIMPDNDDGKAIAATFVDTVVLLLNETHWLDFQAALDAIGRLQDVTLQAFGAKLSFFKEFQANNNFNLQLELRRTAPEQIRTAIVFDKARWTLPSPPSTN